VYYHETTSQFGSLLTPSGVFGVEYLLEVVMAVSPKLKSRITTHVLDLDYAGSAVGMSVLLEFLAADGWQEIAQGVTNSSGRIEDLVEEELLTPGIYRLSYSTRTYMDSVQGETSYPYVPIVFEIKETRAVFEVSLMLSAMGYSTHIEVKVIRA
jgi:hydroxyisourate hydrolase